jgi:propionyl-CoA carboxylase beta chain
MAAWFHFCPDLQPAKSVWTHAEKICKVMDMAMKVGALIIGLNDSGCREFRRGGQSRRLA